MVRCPKCNGICEVPSQRLGPELPSASERLRRELSSTPTSFPAETLAADTFGGVVPSAGNHSSERFYVRIPSGQSFGPADYPTIQEWAAQGRINETCDICPEGTDVWIDYSAWKRQQAARMQPSRPVQDARNIYGEKFGGGAGQVESVPIQPAGLGIWILSLSMVSWVLCITFFGSLICSFITILLAIRELRRIGEGLSPQREYGMVIVGLVLASLCFLLSALFVGLFVIGLIIG